MVYRPSLVFYHHPCSDGITAAAVIMNAFGTDGVRYRPGNYSKADEVMALIDECRGEDVLMVDYTFKPDVLERVAGAANSVVILDHHASAQLALEGYHNDKNLTLETVQEAIAEHKVVSRFDMKECGSTLAWLFVTNNEPYSRFLSMIREVDLHLSPDESDTDNFKWWSRSQPLDVERWTQYIELDDDEVEDLFEDGRAVAQFARTRIDLLCKEETRYGVIGGVEFPYLITDYAFASDVANTFVEDMGYALGVAIYHSATSVGFSLRSVKSLDCSKIASNFGGGGHPQAAGFNIPWADFGDFLEMAHENGMIDLSDLAFLRPEPAMESER